MRERAVRRTAAPRSTGWCLMPSAAEGPRPEARTPQREIPAEQIASVRGLPVREHWPEYPSNRPSNFLWKTGHSGDVPEWPANIAFWSLLFRRWRRIAVVDVVGNLPVVADALQHNEIFATSVCPPGSVTVEVPASNA